MPLYSDYLYGGNSSSFSSPYYSHASSSSSSSPPSSPYSRVGTHWPIIGYSPLTALLSANISSLNTSPRRTYTPYLSSISEKSSGIGRHLPVFGANRHSPKSKLLYYKSRPVTINTENINLSKENIKEKKDSVSRSGPIQRGKTVVRMHTKKLKENPGLKKVKKTPGAMLMEKFLIKEPPKEDAYNWREEYNNKKNQMAASEVSPVRSTPEEEQEENGMKPRAEEQMIIDESFSPKVIEENLSKSNAPVVTSSMQQRRMSITDERLQEEAAIFDSLIQEEMKEGQNLMEVRRRRKSADLLEEDSSVPLEDPSTKKTGKKKYVRQPSGDRSSRTLPLDLVETSAQLEKTNIDEDLKKSAKKRSTVKRKNPLKLVVNEITVEEKVEPPKVPRKLNYEVIVEEGKEDSNDDTSENSVVISRPRPSLAIKRRATIKRMFSRDKEALAARSASVTENASQDSKTEIQSECCSKSTDNVDNIPPPVIYRTEFFLKGEDPILEEPTIDVGKKDQDSKPPADMNQSRPDEKSSPEPSAGGNQSKTDEKTNSIPSNISKLSNDLNSLKPLSKFSFSKDSKQQKIPEISKPVEQNVKLKNEIGRELKARKENEKTDEDNKYTTTKPTEEAFVKKKKNETLQDMRMTATQDSIKGDASPLVPIENSKNVESSPPVTYRTEFVLWGSTEESSKSENAKNSVIQEENIQSFSNTNSIDSSKKIESAPLSLKVKTKEIPEEKKNSSLGKPQSLSFMNIQKQKLESSPTNASVDKKTINEASLKVQPAILNKSKAGNGLDDRVSTNSLSEEKQTTTPSQDKRKQSIFGDNLVKNDNIKIFGIQVKSNNNTPPKVDGTGIFPKFSAEMKPGDNKKEDQNEVKRFRKIIAPQFLNETHQKLDNESAIQNKNEVTFGVHNKNVMEQKSLEFDSSSATQEKHGSALKNENSFTETMPTDQLQTLLTNKNTSLPKGVQNPPAKEKITLKITNMNDKGAVTALDEKKNIEDKTKNNISNTGDSRTSNQQEESCSSTETPKKIVVEDKKVESSDDIKGKLTKQVPIQKQNIESIPDKCEPKATVKVGIDGKFKATDDVKTKSPLFGMKNMPEQMNLKNSDKEKGKPNSKLMNGGKVSTSSSEVSIIGEKKKHLSKEEKKLEVGTKKKEESGKQEVSGSNSTSFPVNKEVIKDNSKKAVGKTKDRSDNGTKTASPMGTKKWNQNTKKDSLIKDDSESKSGDTSVVEKVAVGKNDKEVEEKTVISVSSSSNRNSDKIAKKTTEVTKVSEKKYDKGNSEIVKKKTEITKPESEEKDAEEGRMTVRRRMTKHKTNLCETRMSLMKFEEKKRKAVVSQQEDEKKVKKENATKQSAKQSSKLVGDVKDIIGNKLTAEGDVKVEVISANNRIATEEDKEDLKKEDSDDDDDDEDTETGGESSEDEESTEVESSSEYESDGSAESRERSSGSPLRHLNDTTLGLGGLDEVTTTEVSRCRVTPPATTLPRFRKYSIQDFQFLKVLGKGSFGKVLLAELIGTECYYAVKCLKKDVVLEDDDVECTLIERKVLALGTNHPYLCHLFCTFQTESHLFFVMEYLNGGDLMFHIQQSGRFDEGRARFYASEIVSGLMFLHKKGIVYRDLKLDNILLDFDGHVRIADFGMCKLQIYLDRTADTFCGTPDYMAPEIIKGLAYNQCVDWWSFGILLYEMLVGQSPFSGCDEDDLFWSICNEQPHYPRFLSKESKLILSQLLEKDSSRRLGSSELSGREVTSHVFFRDWDWFRLEHRQLEPPFKPRVRHPLDVQYFDKAFTNERPRLTPIDKSILQSMDQTQFQGFSYTNPNVTK